MHISLLFENIGQSINFASDETNAQNCLTAEIDLYLRIKENKNAKHISFF